jgi:hypothetical protein
LNFLYFSFILDLHYEFHYRDQIPFTKEDEKKNLIADISMGVVMAFVIYKCYSETEHLVVSNIEYIINKYLVQVKHLL